MRQKPFSQRMRKTPNLPFERDAAKARRPSTLRWASQAKERAGSVMWVFGYGIQ